MKSLLEIKWIALLLVAIGGLWLALVSFQYAGKHSSDLVVCEGEREAACPAHTNFLGCDSNIDAFAQTVCRKYAVMPAAEDTRAGGQCGYKITRVICER